MRSRFLKLDCLNPCAELVQEHKRKVAEAHAEAERQAAERKKALSWVFSKEFGQFGFENHFVCLQILQAEFPTSPAITTIHYKSMQGFHYLPI